MVLFIVSLVMVLECGLPNTHADSVDFEKHKVEAHTVAGLLKQFFKEMPEPLFTFSVSDTILTEVGACSLYFTLFASG